MKRYYLREDGLLFKILRRIFNRELLKNKLYSIPLMLMGYVSMKLLGDCTVFILTLFLGLPVFFSDDNVIT